MACANDAEPLQLWWESYALGSDYSTYVMGIQLEIGTPAQSFSLRPSVYYDNVIVSSITDCESRSNQTCVAYCGGVYDFASSPTHTYDKSEDGWNGTHDTDAELGNYGYFNDDIAFGWNSSIAGFPFLVDQSLYGTPGVLPLGPDSAFLSAAVNSSSAPSRNWGLWTGSRSVTRPVAGLLVVGGFDTARVQQSTSTRFPTFSGCTACVVVTDLTYEYPGGSASLFSNSSQVLEISLEPYESVIDLPQHMFDNFADISQGYYNSTLRRLTYPAANPPLGNLSVTLKGGYTTVIPAEELFTPLGSYNSTGDYDIVNSSVLYGEMTSLNSAGPWYWGIPYLTMNYMIMDYDQKQFSLAQAYRDDFDNLATPLINPLCTPTVSSKVSPTASSSGGPPSPPGPHSHTGAIAGGVVGGVAGLVLIGVLLFFLMRLRKRRLTRPQEPSPEQVSPPANEKEFARFSSYTDKSLTEKQGNINELPFTPEEIHMYPNITAPVEMPAYRND